MSSSAGINLGKFLSELCLSTKTIQEHQKIKRVTGLHQEERYLPHESQAQVFEMKQSWVAYCPFPQDSERHAFILFWLALCPLGEAMFVEGCCYKGRRAPSHQVCKKTQNSSLWSLRFSCCERLRPRGCCGSPTLLHFHRNASFDSQFDILHASTGVEKGFM